MSLLFLLEECIVLYQVKIGLEKKTKNIVLQVDLLLLFLSLFVVEISESFFLLVSNLYCFLLLSYNMAIKNCGSIFFTTPLCEPQENIPQSDRFAYWMGSFKCGHTSHNCCCSVMVNDVTMSTTWVHWRPTWSWLYYTIMTLSTYKACWKCRCFFFSFTFLSQVWAWRNIVLGMAKHTVIP